MEIPWLLQVAIDRRLGVFYHDQFKMTLPAGAKVVLDYTPPDRNLVWAVFNLTFGNIAEDSFEVWHACGYGMKRHLDPMWYSIGIGASLAYPIWIYASWANPHTLEIENVSGAMQTADVTVWFVEFTTANFERFQQFVKGVYSYFYALGSMTREEVMEVVEAPRLRLYADLYPEFREALARRLRPRAEELIQKLGLRVRWL